MKFGHLREHLSVEHDVLLFQGTNKGAVVLEAVLTKCCVQAGDVESAHSAFLVAAVAERVFARVLDRLERCALLG